MTDNKSNKWADESGNMGVFETPDEAGGGYIERYIEERRREFYDEWFEYAYDEAQEA